MRYALHVVVSGDGARHVATTEVWGERISSGPRSSLADALQTLAPLAEQTLRERSKAMGMADARQLGIDALTGGET